MSDEWKPDCEECQDEGFCDVCDPATPEEIEHATAIRAAFDAGDWERFRELVAARVLATT